MTNQLVPVEFEGQRILTTDQLAQAYGTEATNIKSNYNASKDKFIEGMHYFKLEGADLKAFKDSVRNSDLVGKNANRLYLWTKRGASRHCKMLGTNKAWEQFDILEESYFEPHGQLRASQLSPQLQLLINIELQQKELAQRQERIETKLDTTASILCVRPNQWRSDCAGLLKKAAFKVGGIEFYGDLQTESYKLLDARYHVDLTDRLTRKKQRALDNGMPQSRVDKINRLDVIADDPKLIEGYVAIVKEIAMRHELGRESA